MRSIETLNNTRKEMSNQLNEGSCKSKIVTGYYINQAGKLCSTDNPPAGCHFECSVHSNFTSVLIVSDVDGEVIDEHVLWNSIESIESIVSNETNNEKF